MRSRVGGVRHVWSAPRAWRGTIQHSRTACRDAAMLKGSIGAWPITIRRCSRLPSRIPEVLPPGIVLQALPAPRAPLKQTRSFRRQGPEKFVDVALPDFGML